MVVTDVDDEFALKYIGGRGWGAKIVLDNLMKHPDLKPLGPENVIVIARRGRSPARTFRHQARPPSYRSRR
ncbi:MAG: aldehyde ferredoxin oxidoreductase N-terminal domain-containing protein [Candidatus Methanospirareceae archaeon]